MRGVAAGALATEAIVLLLGIQPMRVLGVRRTGLAVFAIIALAVACVTLAGLLRRAWAWHAASALQAVIVACGLVLHWSLAMLGVVFGLVWGYVLHLRRSLR